MVAFQFGDLQNKHLAKQIKDLQRQFFGVIKTYDMKELVDLSEDEVDPDLIEGLRRKQRLDKVVSALDKKSPINMNTCVLLFAEDFAGIYIASYSRTTVFDNQIFPEYQGLIHAVTNHHYYANVKNNNNLSLQTRKFLKELNIQSIIVFPIRNVKKELVGFLPIVSDEESVMLTDKDVKNIFDSLERLKVVLTTDEIDLEEL